MNVRQFIHLRHFHSIVELLLAALSIRHDALAVADIVGGGAA